MKTREFIEVVTKAARAHRDHKVSKRIALLVRGERGIGKTTIGKEIATDLDMAFISIRPGQMEPGDLIGLPVREQKNGVWVSDYAKPSYLPVYKLDQDGKPQEWTDEDGVARKVLDIESLGGYVRNREDLLKKLGGDLTKVKGVILLIDEINRVAQDDTKQAIFELPEYSMHSWVSPEGVFILAAANPDTNSYQVSDIFSDAAFLDRWTVIDLEPEANDWLAWAMKNKLSPIVTSFVNADTSVIFDKTEEMGELPIYATPRSMVSVHVWLEEIERPESEQTLEEVLIGIIGSERAHTLMVHMKENMERVLSAKDIVVDYPKWRHMIQKAASEEGGNNIGYLHQCLRNLYAEISDEEKAKELGFSENRVNILEFFKDLPADLRVSTAKQWLAFKHLSRVISTTPEIFALLEENVNVAFARKED